MHNAEEARGTRVKTGEPDYHRVRHQLLRSVGRVCPPWLRDHKEDIVQVAMVKVMETWSPGEHKPGPPSSYLWKVAYTTTVDQIRKIRRSPTLQLDTEELVKRAGPGPDTPERNEERREMGRAIQACLANLQERRRLIVGFYLLGHDLAESERLSGWDGKKVRNLLYRGLSDLRGSLAGKGYHP